jgi:archaeosine synthase alpha-subunit
MRSAEAIEGLAVLGPATIGPLGLRLPALIEAAHPGEPHGGLRLDSEPAPSGFRRLTLSDGRTTFAVEVPILAPEIRPDEAGIRPAGEGAVLLHTPVRDEALRALRGTRPSLAILGNARALWNDGAPFVSTIRALRSGFGAGPALWAPRVALPHRLPLLAYLGVDLFDTVEGEILAARGVFLDRTLGPVDATASRTEGGCGCPGCRDETPDRLTRHVRYAFRDALSEVRTALRGGRLRELVEARLVAEPALAEMLRRADRELGELLDQRTAATGSSPRNYVLQESYRRPEMARFRRQLVARYRPPPSKSVLLLVPCSKTKPYRRSRSHRRFASALDGLGRVERVHVVSVSSPIGLVPRELEDLPPARHYDIPVTGEWTETERSGVTEGLAHLLRTGRYRSVVVHLDPAEYAFLREFLPSDLPVRWTLSDDRTTSSGAVAALREAVTAALAPTAAVPGGPLAVVREELTEIAAVQFGRDAAERLFAPPVRLAGRPWAQRVTDGHHDLATWSEERGLFHLTVAGAARLGDALHLRVEVDAGVRLEGDLFVPGVRSAADSVRAGDAVGLFRDGALAAVGEAALPGPLMTELDRGLAVRVRHRARTATDTALTPETPRPEPGPVV